MQLHHIIGLTRKQLKSEELHERLQYLLERMKIAYDRKKKLKTVRRSSGLLQETNVRKEKRRRGKRVAGKTGKVQHHLFDDMKIITMQPM